MTVSHPPECCQATAPFILDVTNPFSLHSAGALRQISILTSLLLSPTVEILFCNGNEIFCRWDACWEIISAYFQSKFLSGLLKWLRLHTEALMVFSAAQELSEVLVCTCTWSWWLPVASSSQWLVNIITCWLASLKYCISSCWDQDTAW